MATDRAQHRPQAAAGLSPEPSVLPLSCCHYYTPRHTAPKLG